MTSTHDGSVLICQDQKRKAFYEPALRILCAPAEPLERINISMPEILLKAIKSPFHLLYVRFT